MVEEWEMWMRNRIVSHPVVWFRSQTFSLANSIPVTLCVAASSNSCASLGVSYTQCDIIMVSGDRVLGIKPWLCHFLARWSFACY